MKQIKKFYGQDFEKASFEDLANLVQELAKTATSTAYWDQWGGKSREIVFRRVVRVGDETVTTERIGGIPAFNEKECLEEIACAIAQVTEALKEKVN